MNSSPSLVILAGGLGSRYKGSKQIDKFGEQDAFLLEFAMYDAVEAGFKSIVLILNKHVYLDMKSKLSHWESRITLHFVLQELTLEQQQLVHPNRNKPWGTAHALLCAKPFLNDSFVVMNADDYYGQTVMKTACMFFLNEAHSHGLLSYSLADTLSEHGGVSRGLCSTTEQGFLEGIVECHGIYRDSNGIHSKEATILSATDRVSMNLWFFQVHIFEFLEAYFQGFFAANHSELSTECYLPSMVQSGIQQNSLRVKLLSSQEKWVGLTFPEDKNSVMQYLSELTEWNVYPKSFSL
jgi:UTP-glucose-1-phosphate uridylyltransferase